MKHLIDFSSVRGEGTVAQSATVDKQVVNDLFKAFMAIPQEVVVKFKHADGYLKMVVHITSISLLPRRVMQTSVAALTMTRCG